MFVCRHTKDIS